MDDNIKRLLGIDDSAVELVSMINFLFSVCDYNKLVNDCIGLSGKQLNKYVYDTRRKKIKNTRYSDIDEFIKDFGVSKDKALERLFQEPLNTAKLSKLSISDPVRIFEIYNAQKPDIRYMNFIRLI